MLNPASIDVLILCGGLGRRLRSVVRDRPKPMAVVGGRPFVDHLLAFCAAQGFRRFILCTGYRGRQVASYYARRSLLHQVECSLEPKPLGTGGAIRFAKERIQSDPVLVLNGDSFCDVDLGRLLGLFLKRKAIAAMALARVEEESRFGKVRVDRTGRILGFQEKGSGRAAGWINAGVYVFRRSLIGRIPKGRPFSLEKELFPALARKGFYGMKCPKAAFVDIGVPAGYRKARALARKGCF